MLERLRGLSAVFAIDLCAYVLYVDAARARRWTLQEVVSRWTRLFKAPVLIERWQRAECGEAEVTMALAIIECWRQRLFDVSWYMRTLNEHLARRAHAEDDCTGRFWEGRFKSQALLDEAGLLTAMAYVDLNPIRAGIAGTPEESTFTSLYARIEALQAPKTHAPRSHQPVAVPLLPFRGVDSSIEPAIPFTQHDYLTPSSTGAVGLCAATSAARSLRISRPSCGA